MSDLQPGPVGRVLGGVFAGLVVFGCLALLVGLIGRELGRGWPVAAMVVGVLVVGGLLAMTFTRTGRGDRANRL